MPKHKRADSKTSERSKTEAPLQQGLGTHGAVDLPKVILKSYNLEIRDEEGFIGDRASGRAFRALLDEVRAQVSEVAKDPLGKKPSKDIPKRELDKILAGG